MPEVEIRTMTPPEPPRCTWSADDGLDKESFTLLAPTGAGRSRLVYARVSHPLHVQVRLNAAGTEAFIATEVDGIALEGIGLGSSVLLYPQVPFVVFGVLAPATSEVLRLLPPGVTMTELSFGGLQTLEPQAIPVPACDAVGLVRKEFNPRDALTGKRRRRAMFVPPTLPRTGDRTWKQDIRATPSGEPVLSLNLEECIDRTVDVVDEDARMVKILWEMPTGSILVGWVPRSAIRPATGLGCGIGGEGRISVRPHMRGTRSCDHEITLFVEVHDAQALVQVGRLRAKTAFESNARADGLSSIVTHSSAVALHQDEALLAKSEQLEGCTESPAP